MAWNLWSRNSQKGRFGKPGQGYYVSRNWAWWEGYLRVLLPRLPLDLLEQAARMAGSARIPTELQRQDLLQIISLRVGELPLALRHELTEQALADCATKVARICCRCSMPAGAFSQLPQLPIWRGER